MALVVKDRVQEITGTTGTGTVTLGGAVLGYQSFSTVGNGNTTYYTIVDLTAGDWEVGIGTYNSATPSLSRDTVLSSSNAGLLVPFGVGTKNVFVTYPSERSVYLDSPGSYPVQSTFNSLTAATATLTAGTISTAPTNGTDIVNKDYADSIASGLNYHQPVNYASVAALPSYVYNNGTLGVNATITASVNGVLSFGGGSPTAGQRLLVKDETGGNAPYNGVYTVTSAGSAGSKFQLTRATDYDSSGTGTNEVDAGDYVLVISGTNASTAWVQQTPLPIVIGTTALTFLQFNAPITYNAGTGLNLSPATTFNISNTGVTAATYGSASQVPVFAVNAQGQITSVTNTAIAIAAGAVSGLAASATTDTTNATNITSGTLPTGRLSGSYTGITGVGTLTAGTWNGSVIGPVYGGTGFGTYAVGDLLYADTTTSLAKLADVAVGNALISGGVGSAPSWGKIGLATHTSGILPIANGGTGNTTGSAGSVANALTINNGGAGAVSGSTFNGSSAVTISYNTVGAPSTTGTGASGTWSINVTGSAGSATTASNVAGTTATAIQSAYQAAINTTTPGTGTYGIHFNGQTTADYASGITWNGGTTTTQAQAGIYVQGSGAYGTKMYIATTDSYAAGAKTALSIDHSGTILTTRSYLQATGSLRAPIFYDSDNTAYYLNPSASGGIALNTQGEIRFTNNAGTITHFNYPYGGTDNYIRGTTYFDSATVYFSPGVLRWYGNAYDADDTAYYINLAGTSNINQLNMNGPIVRTVSGQGYLNGNYPSSETVATSGAIYSIGGAYVPGTTTLNNMYGVGYTYTGPGRAVGNPAGAPSDLWGLYGAAAGTANWFLDATNGRGYFASQVNATIFYDANNTGYYLDPNGTSVLNGAIFNGSSSFVYGGVAAYMYGQGSVNGAAGIGLNVYSSGGSGAIMAFHRGGAYAVNMGLDSDNVMRIGGWSAPASLWQLDMSGNNYLSGSSRAPIFYDSNNTGYYVDPASVSNLNGLEIGGSSFTVGGGTISITSGSPLYFMARAWLNYSGVSQTIRASVNVSSVTYVGVGDYVVNFSTAMPDINYATTVSCGRNGTGVGGYLSIVSDRIAQTTSAVQVYTFTFSGAATDTPYIAVHVFR